MQRISYIGSVSKSRYLPSQFSVVFFCRIVDYVPSYSLCPVMLENMIVGKVPIPTDPHELPQFIMCRLHNAFETAFNNTLTLLEEPRSDDLKNFLGYCKAWCKVLLSHHNNEELIMFPYLQRRLDFAKELEQHRSMHKSLEELLEKIALARKDPTKFDPKGLIQILKSAEDNLKAHLRQEIEDLAPERLKVFAGEEMEELMSSLYKYVMKHENPVLVLPFVRSHTPAEYKSWPPLPWAIEKLLLPLLALRHRGYWKYSPYSI
ncbi:hypothetical protein V1525DRAFT_402206 [Lipomyces kononenkoae]|uniref:Uncharacterized protein n=1 Tax=Lipomyces kononenkoae TaxID=34357 RepID=A0ACC3T2W2_LIPKO